MPTPDRAPAAPVLDDRRRALTRVPVPGWRLAAAAGFVPLAAGLFTLLTLWVAVASPGSPLWTGLGHLGFTYAEIADVGSGAAAWLELNGSVGGVNVIAAAVAVIVVSRFALREGQRWAWWFLVFSLLWVGLHDAVMATRFFIATGQPVALLPYTYVTLMTAGLVRSREVGYGPAGGRLALAQSASAVSEAVAGGRPPQGGGETANRLGE